MHQSFAQPNKLPVSVIMITLNEEHCLLSALQNTSKWAAEIFIVDSLSNDRTVDIALDLGARVVQHPFTSFGDQWNFALEALPIKTPWTLKLDPDERLSPELQEELGGVLNRESEFCAYSMNRRFWFMGRPLRVQAPVLRLWRTGECRFSDVLVNEHPIVNGRVGKLRGVIEHYDSPDLAHWFEKQNRYTTLEAIMRAKGTPLAAKPKLLGSALERRMFLKKIFYHLPFRYQLLWLNEAILRGAWRSGKVGLEWARLRVLVYRMIELKTKEMRMTGRIPEASNPPHGDFHPRVLSSPLQELVTNSKDPI